MITISVILSIALLAMVFRLGGKCEANTIRLELQESGETTRLYGDSAKVKIVGSAEDL